jgi:K+-transporting ATPase c subunit
MVDATMLRLHKVEHNQAVTMLFARCTQQEVVSVFGVNQSNVRQLNVRLQQLNSRLDPG